MVELLFSLPNIESETRLIIESSIVFHTNIWNIEQLTQVDIRQGDIYKDMENEKKRSQDH